MEGGGWRWVQIGHNTRLFVFSLIFIKLNIKVAEGRQFVRVREFYESKNLHLSKSAQRAWRDEAARANKVYKITQINLTDRLTCSMIRLFKKQAAMIFSDGLKLSCLFYIHVKYVGKHLLPLSHLQRSQKAPFRPFLL